MDSKSLPKKEIITADCDGSQDRHAEKFEQYFNYQGYEAVIYTSKVFKGKVRITIEEIKDV